LVPQLVPGAWLPVGTFSVQTGKPVVQEFVPRWHGFAAGWQVVPGKHALQNPPPQNWFVPQFVPSGRLPLSVQTGAPLVQTIAAVLHAGSVVDGHVAPAVQATQVPALSQT
jgi:hypothetical protein